jgi:signal transduction histidine kinase
MNGLADSERRTAMVLIVDDTPANLAVIVDTLSERGFRVLIALDGVEAVERARYCMPELVLLDVNMGGMDGFETCRRLKADAQTRDIPVIFMTIADGLSEMVEGFRAGGVDYVTKPVRVDELVARMNVHLTMREMQKALVEQNHQLQQEVRVRQQAQHDLSRIRAELELRVEQRTSELAAANDELRAEIEVRQRAEAELRQLGAHMEAIREEERKRIALEIHDELGQLLTALKMDVSLLKMRLSDAPDLLKKVADMRELVELTIFMVRNVANHLRPAALNFGLLSALEWLAEDFMKRTGISCELLAIGCEPVVCDSRATAVFRVVQESLTNVARHAGAAHVHVTVVSGDDALQIHVSDDGCGFDPAAAGKRDSYGLLGISERARLIGATLHIDSAPGCGTVISIGIPAKDGSEHDQDSHRG